MAKSLTIINKSALRQKGWCLFIAVVVFQVLFLAAGYFLLA